MEIGTVYTPDGFVLGRAIIGSPEWRALCEERNEMIRDLSEAYRS